MHRKYTQDSYSHIFQCKGRFVYTYVLLNRDILRKSKDTSYVTIVH